MSVTSSATVQSIIGPTARSIADSPISQFILYLVTAFSWLKYFLTSIASFRPPLLFWPLPILLYLFAPVIVFLNAVVTVFFYGPYKIILYLLDALYPLYVLAGVAFITGSVLGLAGRQLSRLLVNLLKVRSEGKNNLRGTIKSQTSGVDLKGKGKKKENVESEDSLLEDSVKRIEDQDE